MLEGGEKFMRRFATASLAFIEAVEMGLLDNPVSALLRGYDGIQLELPRFYMIMLSRTATKVGSNVLVAMYDI